MELFSGFTQGLIIAIAALFLMLAAYFQSFRLALCVLFTIPAVMAGVALALAVTNTSLNIQSGIGSIMAVGVGVANAILLIDFAERSRRLTADPRRGALDGAGSRLRPILMTSLAMIAGMLPMALATGEGSGQAAPIAIAVIGGMISATLANLLIIPAVFAALAGHRTGTPSLDPDDPATMAATPSISVM